MKKGEANYFANLEKEISELQKYLENPKKINNKIYIEKKVQIIGKYLQFITPYVGVSALVIIFLKLTNFGYPFIIDKIAENTSESFWQNLKTTFLFFGASWLGDELGPKFYREYKSNFVLEYELAKINLAYEPELLKQKLALKRQNYDRLR